MKKAMEMPGMIITVVIVLVIIIVFLSFYAKRADTAGQNLFGCETKGFSCVPADSCSETAPYTCKEGTVCCTS